MNTAYINCEAEYGKRNEKIISFFCENGLAYDGKGTRDLHYKRNGRNVWVTDEKSVFAIYANAEESEKDFYLNTFQKYHPIAGSVKRNPEKSSPKKCCARYEHTEDDFNVMLAIIKDLLGI